jgi:hypothetical protein
MTTALSLFEAASGHLSLECGSLPDSYWFSIVELLENQKGFSRSGKSVLGFDEKIYQSFVSESFSLSSGWDNWSGHYLLADSAEGDYFLRQLYEKLKNNVV